ncbi:DUF2510 domain-containing protein [Homoserinimonas sp. A520]
MTDALSPAVPAGWYPDPWGSTSQRWWDGTSWSANLDPQPEAQLETQPEPQPEKAADAPVPVAVGAQVYDSSAAVEEDYVPVAARSTFEPASSYRDAAAPAPVSPYPSRRTLRELASATNTASDEEHPAALTEDGPMESQPREAPLSGGLPAFTQAPEFSPEPVSALPPPVWQDPEVEADVAVQATTPEPVAETPEPAPALPPVALEPPLPVPETSASSEPATSTPADDPTGADDDWAASLARWEDVETTSAPPDALPIFGDSPPVSYSQRAVKYQPMHGRTSPVWLIVFMPVVQLVSMVGSLYLFPGLLGFDAELFALVPTEAAAMGLLLSLRDWLLFAALPLTFAFFVFTFIMGFQDRARLRLLGHDQTASPWWIVLSPLVYLIVRSVRVRQCTGRRGSGPLTTYVCLYIAPPIALIVARAVTTALSGAIPG